MDATMNIRDMRKQLGDTQSEFAERYNIPFRTVQNWETGMRKPPEYILELLKARIKEDLINKRASALPKYDSNKQDLPKRRDYVGATSWLKAVSESLGDEIVFALDEALMCSGSFGGRSDEFIIWIYGDDRLTRYNGVTVIGNYVSPINVREKNGLKPLTKNWELCRVARYKSQDMVENRYFSHTSPTYGSPFQMMKDFGLRYRTAGENIAFGQRTPQEVMNAWMNSDGHRTNILNPSFTQIGVGYAANGRYWTQMFIG